MQNKEVSSDEKLVQAFVKAVKYMSPRKIGALVSIEQTQTLQEQIATGIPLDAVVTGELLINIFIPVSYTHLDVYKRQILYTRNELGCQYH